MKKDKEINELIDSILNSKKSRVINTIDAKSYLERSKKSKNEKKSSTEELISLLKSQNEELIKMSQENFAFSEEDYQRLQNEIHKDFGISLKDENSDSNSLTLETGRTGFEDLEETMNHEVFGQKEYIHKLCNAFLRPYIVGVKEGMPKNTILLSGPKGSGKHYSIQKITEFLYHRNVIKSPDVLRIDLSLYPTKEEESLFLQDLYENLNESAEVIIFEQAQKCYRGFLDILSDLVSKGEAILSKRYYINAKGQLQDSGTGLVKDSVSSLSAKQKSLIFLSDGKASDLINVFGTTFMNSLEDRLTTIQLEQDAILQIGDRLLLAMIEQAESKLEIKLNIEESWKQLYLEQYVAEQGVHSLKQYLERTYKILGEVRMENIDINPLNLNLLVEDEELVQINENKISIQDFLKQEVDVDIESIKKELNEIVGLNEVKKIVLSMEDHYRVQTLRKKKGLKTSNISKHMIFTGNPGTGKTTIARLISRLMKAVGVLSSGQLVEVTRADLVGKYVGHTAPQTLQVIESALGGVLFIDEAYSLYRGKDDSFGLEAIDTLVKAMEDYRDDLIVILAGYSKEMEEFLTSNSGLKSRFPNHIEFPDYTAEELNQITLSIAKSSEYRIDPSCMEALYAYYEKIQNDDSKTSGNGRLARNTVEKAILNQSRRLLSNPEAELDLLILEDFELND